MKSAKKDRFQATQQHPSKESVGQANDSIYYAADTHQTDSSEADFSIDEQIFGSPVEDPPSMQQFRRPDLEKSTRLELDRGASLMTSVSLHHPDARLTSVPAHDTATMMATPEKAQESLSHGHSLPFATGSSSSHDGPSLARSTVPTTRSGPSLPISSKSHPHMPGASPSPPSSFMPSRAIPSYRPPMQQVPSSNNSSVKHPFFESALWSKEKGFGHGAARSSGRDPFLEPHLLLSRSPSSSISEAAATGASHDFHDMALSSFYWTHMAIFCFIGLFNLIVSKEPLAELIPFSSLYETLQRSSGIFFSSILVSVLISAFWLFMMRNYAALLIWSAIAFVPIGSVLFAVWSLSGLVSAAPSWPLLTCGAIGSILFCVLFILWIRRQSQRVQVSISVTRVTCDLLNRHPGIFYVSIGLLLSYFVYVCIWILFFVHLSLLGSQEPQWHVYRYAYVIQLYFLFSLFWTTAVFGNLQKSMIAIVVSAGKGDESQTTMGHAGSVTMCLNALAASLTRGFGPICYGGLILYAVRAVRLVLTGYKRLGGVASRPSHLHRAAFGLASAFVRSVERLIERFTYNAIYYSAMHGGLGFIASGEAVSRLYRRHLILLISSDYVSHFLFFISSVTFAALSALSIYLYNYAALGDSTDPDSSLSIKAVLFSASLFGTLTYACLSFIGSVVADAMDAAFLLYLLGLEGSSQGEQPKWKLEADAAVAFEALVEREAVRIVDEPLPEARKGGLGV